MSVIRLSDINLEELPSLPDSASEIINLALEPDMDLNTLGESIKKDIGLSTKIIQVANSPLYSPLTPIENVTTAAVNLGLTTVKNLVLSLTIMDTMNSSIDLNVFKYLSDHSFCAATLTHAFASEHQSENIDSAFFCGLIHNLGLYALASIMRDSFASLLQESISHGVRFKVLLESNTKVRHQELGANLAKEWKLPDIATNAILYQDDIKSIPKTEDGKLEDLAMLVNLGVLSTEIYFDTNKILNINQFKNSYEEFYDKDHLASEQFLNEMGEIIDNSFKSLQQASPAKQNYSELIEKALSEACELSLEYEKTYLDFYKENFELKRRESDNAPANEPSPSKHETYVYTSEGLPDKQHFKNELSRCLSHASRHKENCAVLIININDFDTITDNLGEEIGSTLQLCIAHRINQNIRAGDFAACLNNGKFALIVTKLKNSQMAGKIAYRIRGFFREPMTIKDYNLPLTVNIGISCFPQSGETASKLMKNAEVALTRAQEKGVNQFHYFSKELGDIFNRRVSIENALAPAMKNNEFRLVYHPIISLKNGATYGFEALLRWHSSILGDIGPSEFVPIAEECGEIINLGHWVIDSCIEGIASLEKQGLSDLIFAINVAPQQLTHGNIVGNIKKDLEKYQVKPSSIVIEMTETDVMKNLVHGEIIIKQLNVMGVNAHIDDFGTGHSSLLRLTKLPFKVLKIDRAFIQGLPHDESHVLICKSIIDLAKSLNLHVIAEGIETKEQLRFLIKHGCDFGQGFYFSKPVEFAAIADLAKKRW